MVSGVGVVVSGAIVDQSQRVWMRVSDRCFRLAARLSFLIFLDNDLFVLLQVVPCFWNSRKVR